jgi:nifR3 family TIM-barrel protein
MKDPDLACALVAAACRQTQKPVTVKMRIGIDSEHVDPVNFAKRLEDAGAAAVTVHGRTREQYYSGPVHRDVIRDIKKVLSIPVIGNGDVKDSASAQRMFEETGCDGIMVARGAQGNPWLFRDLKVYGETGKLPERPSPEEIKKMILRHAVLLTEEKGEYIAMREMRKHIGWYTAGLPGGARLRRDVNEAVSMEQVKELLDRFLLERSPLEEPV